MDYIYVKYNKYGVIWAISYGLSQVNLGNPWISPINATLLDVVYHYTMCFANFVPKIFMVWWLFTVPMGSMVSDGSCSHGISPSGSRMSFLCHSGCCQHVMVRESRESRILFGIKTVRIGIFQLKKHGEKTCEKRCAKNPPVHTISHVKTYENHVYQVTNR